MTKADSFVFNAKRAALKMGPFYSMPAHLRPIEARGSKTIEARSRCSQYTTQTWIPFIWFQSKMWAALVVAFV
jgi:hypothetical protein